MNRGWRFCRYRRVVDIDAWLRLLVAHDAGFYVVFGCCCSQVAPRSFVSRVVRSQSFDRWCERVAGLLNRSALALLDAVCLASAESIAWMTESRGDVRLRCNVSSGRTPNRNATQIGGTSAPWTRESWRRRPVHMARRWIVALLFCHSRIVLNSENEG